MSTVAEARAAIYERLQNAPQYHPANADTFLDWNTQAGDVITIQRDGEDYRFEVAPNPVPALRNRRADNTTVGRVYQ